jgi:uncharacterized protein
MENRSYWKNLILYAWSRRKLIWLKGVRRVGKTTLCNTLENTCYFDCELPSVRRLVENPEFFLREYQGQNIVLDEIHRLKNPTELLKIAADHFGVNIIATGSSTLGASKKFRDTLTGRKTEIWLTPMIGQDLIDFGAISLKKRLTYGGLPGFLLEPEFPFSDFQEWMDSYWAKDIQELFALQKRYSFQTLLELLFTQSGGIFEATRFTSPCEVSRVTIVNYLKILEDTLAVYIIRPFSTHKSTEIISAPKIYGFDTGLVSYFKGWQVPRETDFGPLWEHMVLNELVAYLQTCMSIRYWRDKQHHEVDFILDTHHGLFAIECKWSSAHLTDLTSLKRFLFHYPHAIPLIVCADIVQDFTIPLAGYQVRVVSLASLTTIVTAR